MEVQKARILLADPYSLFREGLRTLLKETGEFSCVGSAEEEAETLKLVSTLRPDLLILDICVSEKIGNLLHKIRLAAPDCPVFILTHCEDESRIESCFRAGIDGYLLKDTKPAQLLNAIRTVCSGEQVLCAKARSVIAKMTNGEATAERKHPLREREIEVLRLAAKGFTNKEIASLLDISKHTVASHFITIYRKLNVRSHTEAALLALEADWIPHGELAASHKRRDKDFC
jgi:NarL family two-component system response regulator LiaR